jgi:hypothetical protein
MSITHLSAQKNVDPTPEDVKQAVALREKYPKSDLALLSSKEHITFTYNKYTKKVEVVHSKIDQLMNINHNTNTQLYEFYDDETEITRFKVQTKNKKEYFIRIFDEYYKDDDYFYHDARVKFTDINFPLQGFSYLFEVDKTYKDLKYFANHYLTESYPIVEKEIVIEIPKWLDVSIKEFNFEGYSITKNVSKVQDTDVYTYKIINADPMLKEPYCPGPTYLYPHLLFVFKSFSNNGNQAKLFESTADLYGWYHSLVKEIEEDPSIYKPLVQQLKNEAKTDEDKIKAIYYWVQDNIRYIAFEDGIAGFKPESSQNVFKNRYGDCKGMANLTKNMLKEAGFDARLSWIGTKHIAYDYSFPSLAVDNHMICTLIHQNKKYYLDSTIKYGSLGENSENIMGKEVMIEDGEQFIIEKIPVEISSHNQSIETINMTLENETIKGNIQLEYKNESKTHFLMRYHPIKVDKKEDALKYYLNSDNKNLKVQNIVTSDLNNRDIPIKIQYDFTLENQISSFDNELYIDMNYEKILNDFDFKERKTDYLFPYKSRDIVHTNLTIPAGYKVSKLPENLSIVRDDYEITMTYELKDQTIVYTKTYDFKSAAIRIKNINQWEEDFKKLKKHYADQVVLIK